MHRQWVFRPVWCSSSSRITGSRQVVVVLVVVVAGAAEVPSISNRDGCDGDGGSHYYNAPRYTSATVTTVMTAVAPPPVLVVVLVVVQVLFDIEVYWHRRSRRNSHRLRTAHAVFSYTFVRPVHSESCAVPYRSRFSSRRFRIILFHRRHYL